MGNLYFDRTFRVELYPDGAGTAGEAFGPPLHARFNLRHTRGKSGGAHTVSLTNLSRETIRSLRTGSFVAVYAGYASDPDFVSLLASGEIIKAGIDQNWTSPDCVTTIKFQSGFKASTRSVKGTWRHGTTLRQVFVDLTDQVAETSGPGRAPSLAFSYDHLSTLKLKSSLAIFDTFGGALTTLETLTGLEAIERDGSFTLTDDPAPRLSSWPLLSWDKNTLIGTPQIDNEGLKVKTFLDGQLRPGVRVIVEHPDYGGGYAIRDTEFVGDSGFAPEFDTNLVLRRL